jgi:putative glycosyltransferase (TIGR04372 family)
MDIYLGAKCFFAISTSTGWDAIPYIFRRPIAYVNMVPLGILFTFSPKFIAITKHHISKLDGRELAMKEIFSRNVGFCTSSYEFNDKGVKLVDNTPEEIRDLVVEMADRLEGVFQSKPEDKYLQSTFRRIFPKNAKDAKGIRLHGKIYSHYGSIFLRNNNWWLNK